jgi:hypothetical protein
LQAGIASRQLTGNNPPYFPLLPWYCSDDPFGVGDAVMDKSKRVPSAGAIAEAKKNPDGWVYEIDGEQVADPDGEVPPRAIIGAWQVDGAGRIVGEFKANPNYLPKQSS